MKNFLVASFISVLTTGTALHAALSEIDKKEIISDIQDRRYDHLGAFLNKQVGHTAESLDEIKRIAFEHNSESLLRAVEATKKYANVRNSVGLRTGAFLQAAFFIERDLERYTLGRRKYLRRKKTGLKRPLEYDPRHKSAFIVLDGMKSAYLGSGAKKTAYKAISYNNGLPVVVARAQQRGGMKHELKITKRLQGQRGVLAIEGYGKHKKYGKKYTTIYTKLYQSGDLKTAFREDIKFSLYEKMRIALQALWGLESMHRKKIVHRDLSAQNIFLNIPKGMKGRRKIEAVIADFGWSKFAKWSKHKKAQANLWHTAPEALYFKEMKGKEYYACDVYALGLVFYNLLYEKKAPWKKIETSSKKKHYKKLRRKLKREVALRRDQVCDKCASPTKDFKLLIARMISANPKKRGTATELCREMTRIFKDLNSQKLRPVTTTRKPMVRLKFANGRKK